jgi:hypothetical protein
MKPTTPAHPARLTDHARSVAAICLLAALVPDAAAQCPPGVFDYGPPLDPLVTVVVIDHCGPQGPLLPDPPEYARAERDISLLRQAVPELDRIGHSSVNVQGTLVIQAQNPLPPELVCTNTYYAASLRSLGGLNLWSAEFPSLNFNVDAMAKIYRRTPGVTLAGPAMWGCAGFCCGATWTYETGPAGDRIWTIRKDVGVIGGCNLPAALYTYVVTADGNVRPVCYPNCDGSLTTPILSVNDFICFQTRYAAGDPYANCDGSTAAPILSVIDFICFQAQYVSGCP